MNTTESDNKPTLPVLFYHCKDTYDAMLRSSSKQKYRDGTDDKEAVVYEGFLTKLVTEELHLSTPYYTTVMRALKKMGCATQLRRGGSTATSQWRLHHEPTEDLFREKIGLPKKPTSQHKHRMDQHEGMIQDLNVRVLVLEDALKNIIQEEIKDAS